MAKVKYYAKENSTIGTHSFYAVPIPNGTLTFDELLDEAMDGKSVEPSIAKACVTEFMKAVKRNVLKGFRCQLGDNFLTVYPNIQLSVKDPARILLFSENPMWPWQFGNCACEIGNSNLRRIVKGGPIPSHKIDNVFALLDAMWAFDLSEGQVSE